MRALQVLVVCASCLAQQPEPPVYKATTRLVEVSVVALDRQGRAITDLKKEEIEIEDKGKRREVAFFRFEGVEEKREVKPLPPQTYSNRVEYAPGPARNIAALVVDTLNTPPQQTMWVRAQLTRYLKALAPSTRVAVYHLGAKLEAIHDFTDDFESLRARIAKASLGMPLLSETDISSMARDAEQLLAIFDNDPTLEEMLRMQIETEGMANAASRQRKLEGTLRALESLGEHLQGIPGRKSVVWIGAGISMLSVTGAMGFGPHGGFQSLEELVERTSRRLAQQGIVLYVVDSRGLAVQKEATAETGRVAPVRGSRARPFERQEQAEEISADPLGAAYKMAGITGGRVIINTNDMTDGMKKAAADAQGAYTVAFYSEGEADGKWHGLKVKAKRPGVRLVYRQGFLNETVAGPATSWTTEEWRRAAVDPLGASAIGVDVNARKAEGGAVVMAIQLEPSNLHFRPEGDRMVADVEIGLIEKTAAGATSFHHENGKLSYPASRKEGLRASEARYARGWKPQAAATHVRVVVRDKATGQTGTLDVPLPRE